MATHSCILAWEILWTEEPGRLQSMGSQRVRYDLAFGEDLYFLVSYIKLSFSNFSLHRNFGIPGGKSINTKICAFLSKVIKINHGSFLFSIKFQEEKHLENIDCDWRILLSIYDKKNQIILEQEYVVLRPLSGNNLSVISGWKRWVAMVSCSAQIELHLATLIFVVIFPLLMKYHKHSAIIATAFLWAYISPDKFYEFTYVLRIFLWCINIMKYYEINIVKAQAFSIFTEMLLFYSPLPPIAPQIAYLDDSLKII